MPSGLDPSRPVLITGGAGFIGVHVARHLLDAGQPVRLLDLQPPSDERRFVLGEDADALVDEMVIASVDDWSAVLECVLQTQPCGIVHIAAVVSPIVLSSRPNLALQVNLVGAVNVFEAARLAGVPRTIFYSSIGTLPTIQQEPVTPDHPTVLAKEGPGAGFYGAAKLGAEAFAHAYDQCYGLDTRIIRPSAVYGLGMAFPIGLKPLVEAAVRGEALELPSGGAVARDYTHVHDLASLTSALLAGPDDADRTFFGATGEPLVSGSRVAELVRDIVPGANVHVADTATEAEQFERRFRGVLSVANAREQLGWSPRYGAIRDGLAEYVESYRAYLSATG